MSTQRHRAPMLHEPLLIEAKQLWPKERLQIELSPFRGSVYFGMRRWYDAGDRYLPSSKGISVHCRHLPMLRHALEKAEREALRAGLLDVQDYEICDLPVPAELR